MKNIRKGAWQIKRGPTPAIPAYKRPRQRKTTETDNIPFSELKEKLKQDKTNTIVLITETEAETEVPDNNDEEDNIPFSELKEKRKQDKTNTIVLITETEPETEARVTEEAVTNTVLERVKVAKHFEVEQQSIH